LVHVATIYHPSKSPLCLHFPCDFSLPLWVSSSTRTVFVDALVTLEAMIYFHDEGRSCWVGTNPVVTSFFRKCVSEF
jgi:hypothetical protein